MTSDERGVLYPNELPQFHRRTPPPELAHAVRWFWIPEWHLPPGVESRQVILPFPACNMVIEDGSLIVTGPASRLSERTLTGVGWAVGALLTPAAALALVPSVSALRDSSARIDASRLVEAVTEIMRPSMSEANPGTEHGTAHASDGEERRDAAARVFGEWLSERVPVLTPDGDLANRLSEVLADPGVTLVDQLAPRLHASTRTLQRLAERAFGLTLRSMIQRRRVQEAAERLRSEPETTVADIANELGYADHAHFSSDFRHVTGRTPRDYRHSSAN